MNRFQYPKAKVDEAIKFLKTNKGKQPSFVKKFPGEFRVARNKLYAGDLLVVPTEDRDEYLRDIVYGMKSEYPFGRDSLFAILQREVLNVSKRDIEAFLNAQGPLVHRRARPKIQKREHLRKLKKPGQLSVDLAHIRVADFVKTLGQEAYDYMGEPGEKGYQQDRYFLNAVCMVTGFLLTEILEGKKSKWVAPALEKILNRYEKASGVAVRKIETDKGGEFKGGVKDDENPEMVLDLLKRRKIHKVEKVTNALVETKNAHMQRVFWILVKQRRGGFLPTVKQTVKITNKTYNRRIGMNPEDAMNIIKNKGTVSMKTPKAGPTERKKAFSVGTQVRALKKPRSKSEQDLSYKRYKGSHFGPVVKILKVKYVGVYPKYMLKDKTEQDGVWRRKTIPVKDKDGKVRKDANKNVITENVIAQRRKKVNGAFVKDANGNYVKENVPQVKTAAVWKWGDELIQSRPGDTKSHNLIVNRPIVLPDVMIPKKKASPKFTKRTAKLAAKAKPKPKPKPKPKFFTNQDVWYSLKGSKHAARVVKVDNGMVEILFKIAKKQVRKQVAKAALTPMPTYEIGDQVRVYNSGQWHNGEVEAFKGNRYVVFWTEDNQDWEDAFKGQFLRPV